MAQSSSPDSSISISSLLASCSLGSSRGSSATSTVEYKDRLYESASDALEAYIQDYEESRHSSTSTGRIHIHPTAAPGFTIRKDRASESPLPKSNSFNSSRKEFPHPPENTRSPRTEDVLEAERSWEQIPYSLKSPVPVSCKDIISKTNLVEHLLKDKKSSSFSGGNHHGPVEALKHMLYNLQTFQQNFSQGDPSEQVKEIQKVYMEAEAEMQRVDQEIFPVNKSLQKAMQHLSRLKELVGDGAVKPDQESSPESESQIKKPS